jgi:undecaprenyl pyrophosphate phosphatase UppP
VSRSDPAPHPDIPAGPPRWLLVLLAAGLSLLVATVLVLLLGVAGVDRINEVLFVVLLVASALVGGWLVRLLAPRLPAVRRPPRG